MEKEFPAFIAPIPDPKFFVKVDISVPWSVEKLGYSIFDISDVVSVCFLYGDSKNEPSGVPGHYDRLYVKLYSMEHEIVLFEAAAHRFLKEWTEWSWETLIDLT